MNEFLPSDLGEPFYEGSVQGLYAVPGDDSVMVTWTTSPRGSVLDLGAEVDLFCLDFLRS